MFRNIFTSGLCDPVYLPDSNRYDTILCFRNILTSGLSDPVYLPDSNKYETILCFMLY